MIECMRNPECLAPPAVGWAAGPLGVVQAADREIARHTAVRARAVAEFAASRPASVDRPPGEPGCMSAERRASRADVLAEVSEWAAQELRVALSISAPAAEALLTRSLTLVHRLPKTLAALEAGVLHTGHLWTLLEKVAPVADRSVRERLEADLLAWVAGRSVTTPAQLGAKIGRELLARDARGAARELEAALRRRGTAWIRPDETDGLAVLSFLLTVPEARALLDALGRYADALDDEAADAPEDGTGTAETAAPRTRAQKMADCLLDRVLRPGETDLPAVQAQLTVVASVATLLGGDQPGEIADTPVPAEMARALARGLGLLPASAPDGAASGPVVDRAGATEEGAGDAALAADEAWWAEVEARALCGEWGGEEGPPQEELERWWVETEQAMCPGGQSPDRCDGACELVPVRPPGTSGGDGTPGAATGASRVPGEESPYDREPSWWAAADAAVEEAAEADLALHGAMARVRRAVEAAELADRAEQDAWEQSPLARISAAPDALKALAAASAGQRAALGALLDRTGGAGLIDRPRIAVTDALTGALLVLTDARGLRAAGSCGRRACRTGAVVCDHDLTGRPGLSPPGECSTYRPGAALDRHVRARDRRCRFPGCRRRVPRGGELDHNQPWPDGGTAERNLTGFCTTDHRGKHQAPGWSYDLAPDGTLTVTTPTGLVAATAPPPY
jgi:hypothetical protein